MSGAIFLLPPARRNEAAAALADAFAEDPFFAYIAPNAKHRLQWLHVVHQSTIEELQHAGHTYAALDEQGRILGAITGAPPGDWPPPATGELKMLLRLLALPAPWTPNPRYLLRAWVYLREWERLHPEGDHWYIDVLGVRHDAWGNGRGRQLVNTITGLADRDGLPTYLMTHTPSNVGFYRSCGFEVIAESRPAANGPNIWAMLRPPGA